MTDHTPTTIDPLGDWFRRIGTSLSDDDYETGIQVLAAHDRKVAAEVWDECAVTAHVVGSRMGVLGAECDPNPYRKETP